METDEDSDEAEFFFAIRGIKNFCRENHNFSSRMKTKKVSKLNLS